MLFPLAIELIIKSFKCGGTTGYNTLKLSDIRLDPRKDKLHHMHSPIQRHTDDIQTTSIGHSDIELDRYQFLWIHVMFNVKHTNEYLNIQKSHWYVKQFTRKRKETDDKKPMTKPEQHG